MNENDAKHTEALITALAAGVADHPADLRVLHQASPDGAVYWAMRGHEDDEPKLVGAGGTHVDALAVLVQEIGRAAGEAHTFRLVTTGEPRERPKSAPRESSAMDYDPAPAAVLFVRLVAALTRELPMVKVEPGAGPRHHLRFMLRAVGLSPHGLHALGDPRKLIKRAATDDRPEVSVVMTPLAAIGTLFRAAGRKSGVGLSVAAEGAP